MIRTLFVAALVVAVATAVPVKLIDHANSKTVEPRHILGNKVAAPQFWQRQERVTADTRLKLIIAVANQNLDTLERTFWEVSDPQHPKYGMHMSKSEVDALTRPSPMSLRFVRSWLANHGATVAEEISQGAFITVYVTAQQAERMLWTEFYWHQHASTKQRLVRAHTDLPYSVPQSLKNHIDFVGGVSGFPTPRTVQREEVAGLAVTPSFLRKHYNVTASGTGSTMQAVAALIGQFYSPADLAEFFTLFSPANKGRNISRVIGPDNGPAGTEANLDVEYIMGVAPGVPTWFWSIASPAPNGEPFLEWITQIANTTNPPHVHSVSYGGDESGSPASYLLRMDAEFQKAGVRGLSLMFASGDSGVGGSCSPDKFAPDWPASSTYVTAVGGSKMSGLFESGHEEVNGLSGGGFSGVYTQPSYQTAAVAKYLQTAKDLPNKQAYNASNRGYPDVSALSSGFVIVQDKVPLPGVAGTSCAAPTFSAIVALLNDLRTSASKSTLGFLNPFIYQTAASQPGAFFDVTEGSNPGCGTDGFHAAAGWDPASGVGTPNYEALATIVKNMQN